MSTCAWRGGTNPDWGGHEERRQKVEQGHGEKCRDNQPGEEDGDGVLAAQRLRIGFRPEAHRRELEKLAAKQIAIDQEECGDVEARNQ